MAGARFRIELTGIDAAGHRLSRLAAAGRDLRPVFEDIGERLVSTTKDRFRDQRDPQGNPWAPLSDDYRERKRRNRDTILTLEGILGGSIAFQASSNELLVGVPSPASTYAGTHQFGAKKGQYGSTSRGQPIPWGDIPAREFLGLSDDDESEIVDIVSGYLAGAVS